MNRSRVSPAAHRHIVFRQGVAIHANCHELPSRLSSCMQPDCISVAADERGMPHGRRVARLQAYRATCGLGTVALMDCMGLRAGLAGSIGPGGPVRPGRTGMLVDLTRLPFVSLWVAYAR